MPQHYWQWAAVLLATSVYAQVDGKVDGAFTQRPLCNGTLDQANATGFFTINTNVSQGRQSGQPDNNSGKALPLDVAFTLATFENGSRLDYSLWVNTRGANFSNNFQLGYDVCAMGIGFLTDEANYEGRDDNGTCSSTFDQRCLNAIRGQAQQYALDLTNDPTPRPNSNLTVNSLPGVCNDIRNMLQDNFPAECSRYYNGTAIVFSDTALTGYNTSNVESGCPANASNGDEYHKVFSEFTDYLDETYDEFARTVFPFLSIWLPIANAERPSTILYAEAHLLCTHIQNFSPQSRVSPELIAPRSSGGDGLGKGAIAGIVIGAVIGVTLIVFAAWWFLVKRPRTQSSIDTTNSPVSSQEEKQDYAAGFAEAPADTNISELQAKDRKFELDNGHETEVHELAHRAYELEGTQTAGHGR